MHRRVLILVCTVAAAIAWSSRDCAASLKTVDELKINKIKCAYLLNFIRFTIWPPGAFADPASPVVVTVLGQDTLGDTLDRTLRGHRAMKRPLVVHRLSVPSKIGGRQHDQAYLEWVSRLRQSHLLFISVSEQPRLSEILGQVYDLPAVTVSDIPGFAEQGGMLGLTIRDHKVVFDANAEVIAASRVSVSSKILKLARVVTTQRGEGRP